jgi:hypothetical protein
MAQDLTILVTIQFLCHDHAYIHSDSDLLKHLTVDSTLHERVDTRRKLPSYNTNAFYLSFCSTAHLKLKWMYLHKEVFLNIHYILLEGPYDITFPVQNKGTYFRTPL